VLIAHVLSNVVAARSDFSQRSCSAEQKKTLRVLSRSMTIFGKRQKNLAKTTRGEEQFNFM
jgi:hypothetical protein